MIPPRHEYQIRATQFCKDHKFQYLAVDMGLGKTRITLDWCETLPCSILVVAPLRTVLSTWPAEIEKWTPNLSYQVLHGKDKDLALSQPAKFYIINYEGLQWLYGRLLENFKKSGILPFRALVIDEGSMVKTPGTRRFKALKPIRDACNEGISILSGTPAPNSLLDLWSQYYLLDGGVSLGTTYTGFKNEYFKPVDRMGFKWVIKNQECADAIMLKIAPNTFRLKAEDYLNLPPYIDNVIPVTMPKGVQKQIKELEDTMMLELAGTTAVVRSAPALGNKLRQVIQGGIYVDEQRNYEVLHTEKLKVLKSLVEEANGQGILCAIQFRFELDMIKKEFPNAPVIAGQSKDDPIKVINDWNKGNIPLLLCHPAALSHGVNLQAGSHIILWYGLPWSLEHYQQLIGRLHRQGQQNTVVVHHLIAEGTIDERVLKALQSKRTVQDMLLEYLRVYKHY